MGLVRTNSAKGDVWLVNAAQQFSSINHGPPSKFNYLGLFGSILRIWTTPNILNFLTTGFD